jgi:hypothetical protein
MMEIARAMWHGSDTGNKKVIVCNLVSLRKKGVDCNLVSLRKTVHPFSMDFNRRRRRIEGVPIVNIKETEVRGAWLWPPLCTVS